MGKGAAPALGRGAFPLALNVFSEEVGVEDNLAGFQTSEDGRPALEWRLAEHRDARFGPDEGEGTETFSQTRCEDEDSVQIHRWKTSRSFPG